MYRLTHNPGKNMPQAFLLQAWQVVRFCSLAHINHSHQRGNAHFSASFIHLSPPYPPPKCDGTPSVILLQKWARSGKQQQQEVALLPTPFIVKNARIQDYQVEFKDQKCKKETHGTASGCNWDTGRSGMKEEEEVSQFRLLQWNTIDGVAYKK